MTNKRLAIGFGLIVSLLLLSCSKQPEALLKTKADPKLISAYTSGIVSRDAVIRVRFAVDAGEAFPIQAPLETSPFAFAPPIQGVAVWADRRTLEFRPGRRLPPGQKYAATLALSDILETAAPNEKLGFAFSTLKQSFEITVDGLQPSGPEHLHRQQLTGKLVTADTEDGVVVEKLLGAFQEDRKLNLSWSHDKDRLRHTFVVEDIQRFATDTPLVLRWDGRAAGSAQAGERVIAVPAAGVFHLLQARAVQGKERYIEIRFSDPLQKQQNLRGLIRADGMENLKFSTDENILRIYATSRWNREITLQVEAGIRSAAGQRLAKAETLQVFFADEKPQVRFAGKGVILPRTGQLTIPIETVNLRAVVVEAMRIYEKNIPQFLQTNDLGGSRELQRVGRVVWKKALAVDFTADRQNRWIRCGLDVTPLLEQDPGGLFRIKLSFQRRHIATACADAVDRPQDPEEKDVLENLNEEVQESYWDSYEDETPYSHWEYYENRHDPCHPGYYRKYHDHDITAARNLLVSDLGLIAKQGGDGSVFVAATDLQTAKPLPDVALTLLDYQQQPLVQGKTGENGTAILEPGRKPFLLAARKGNQKGYVKLDDGSALSVSHFDVSGSRSPQGIKGFIYGERGVWRPGDPIFLTFIRLDGDGMLPEAHPARLELYNPKGQLVERIVRTKSTNGFYCFQTATEPDAPTGNWQAVVRVGGARFEKMLKIETVMPNRLKINLDFGRETTRLSGGVLHARLSAAWLHGVIAKDLASEVDIAFTASRTTFAGYPDYVFDDPTRKYQPEEQRIFEGHLDGQGQAEISAEIRTDNVSPGILQANFTTRVFEPGGAFSVDRFPIAYHPYDRYVGLRVPKGDAARGMLLTDTAHKVQIALLDAQGRAIPEGRVRVEMYKIKWRWWWEKGTESLADYVGSSNYKPISSDTVTVQNGRGEWPFTVRYPQWGRYLIRVSDLDGKHRSGQIVYIDWPGWAGRARKDMPGGAAVLNFSADRTEYAVGENVTLTIPTGQTGTALVSLESGSRVLSTAWLAAASVPTRFTFTATSEMAPNIYAHVTFLQPHLQAGNDLPIRMYGVVPIRILDPQTRLKPIIRTADVFVPGETAEIFVREENEKPMTYTVAIVDEGLLDLTRFKTPDPWHHFYRKEALEVKTWDLFDLVAGAYGGQLERLLAVGGSGALEPKAQKKANRFPPMVRFLGPFALDAQAEGKHQIQIPQYVGSVRVMVVAGRQRSYGAAEKQVFVRKPLMVLGTLPRVLGPGETVSLPVSVFALDKKVKDVRVSAAVRGPLRLFGQCHTKTGLCRSRGCAGCLPPGGGSRRRGCIGVHSGCRRRGKSRPDH